jgi:hypothetical protein
MAKFFRIIRKVPIKKIDRNEGSFRLYMGTEPHRTRIQKMVNDIIYGTKKIKPIRVVPSTRQKGRWRVIDGHHRLTAHQVARKKEIDVVVKTNLKANPKFRKEYKDTEIAYLGLTKKQLHMHLRQALNARKLKQKKAKSSK